MRAILISAFGALMFGLLIFILLESAFRLGVLTTLSLAPPPRPMVAIPEMPKPPQSQVEVEP